ncbi:hypothetical protein GCM10023086_57740 [Streptomyces venetus]|uniref:Uncharacterized protein n=1 Tax=Streptomyces venetus TaxID=1701086 RepID=A0ABP8GRB3_9ACTN
MADVRGTAPGAPGAARRNRRGSDALFRVTAVAGKTPEPPPRPLKPQASPARSSASVPARREASRSSRVKPAGARDRVVTPAAA